MKKFKRLFAVILSLAMILGMSTVASAAETAEKPNAGNKTAINVIGVEDNATVMAYQITKADYNSYGFVGYERVKGISDTALVDPLNPTAAEVGTIARNLSGLPSVELKAGSVIVKDDEGNETTKKGYSAQVNAGYWIVVVTGTSDTIYNPMLLGAYYTVSGSNSTMSNDIVDASSRWNLNGTTAYAKKAEPEITKTIETAGKKGDKGDDAAVGDIVDFKIVTDIPSYSEEYEKIVYKITDELVGLDEVLNIKVYLNTVGNEIPTGKYKIEGEGTNKFTVDFTDSAYIRERSAESNQQVVVTYQAKVTNAAKVNFDAHTNTATLTYTNKPGTDSSGKPYTSDKDDKTYHYTFGIDANLWGEEVSDWNKETEELVKTGDKHKEIVSGREVETYRLSGATFTLTEVLPEGATGTPHVFTATSDERGRLEFTGLDSGDYILVETVAPEGYSVNATEVPVNIKAEFEPKTGLLLNYEIKVNNKNTSTYVATYTKDEITKITYTEKPSVVEGEDDNTLSDSYEFKNTKLAELPSTGGIGTTIFTIGGCLIMIIAAGLFFASRRKSAK